MIKNIYIISQQKNNRDKEYIIFFRESLIISFIK